MEINKQLFEDVLSGKLKGTFVLRNGITFDSKCLKRTDNTSIYNSPYYPYALVGNGKNCALFSFSYSYTENGIWNESIESSNDIVDFIPECQKINLEILECCRKDFEFKQILSKAINNMNTLEIEIPEGKEIDWKQSEKQNRIVLKDKQLTYKDICKKLFENGYYYTSACGSIYHSNASSISYYVNNATTKHQLECILAKNKLANVAKYLNGEWKPDKGTSVWIIEYDCYVGYRAVSIQAGSIAFNCYGLVVFKSRELAEQAINILGEETVKLALEPLGI